MNQPSMKYHQMEMQSDGNMQASISSGGLA